MLKKLNSMLLAPVILIGSFALIAGCASSTPIVDTSPKVELSFDGLYPVKGGAADAAWARPGADISQYSKIMLQGVGIEYRPGGESGRIHYSKSRGKHFEVTKEQKARLVELMRDVFFDELGKSEHFTIVDEPGPDVLLIRGALLDVVSYVPPDTVGRSEIFLSSVGEATLVLEIRDSVSEAIFARAVDRRAAEDVHGLQRSTRTSNASEVRRMVRRWARLLRERLDSYGIPQG